MARKPSAKSIVKKLDALAQAQRTQDELAAKRTKIIASHPEIKALDASLREIGDETAALTQEIKEAVLKIGNTVPGSFLQAVWNKGRTSWDTKALVGYAVSHPELNGLKKVGNPSVSIRKVAK